MNAAHLDKRIEKPLTIVARNESGALFQSETGSVPMGYLLVIETDDTVVELVSACLAEALTQLLGNCS